MADITDIDGSERRYSAPPPPKKKNRLPLIIVLIILAALIGLIVWFALPNQRVKSDIKKNWGITIPPECKLEYSVSNDKSTSEDRVRFRVFSVSDGENLMKALNWQKGEQEIGKPEMEQNVLFQVEADDEYLPTYSGEYYAAAFERYGGSTAVFIYEKSEKRLYLGEHIIALKFKSNPSSAQGSDKSE